MGLRIDDMIFGLVGMPARPNHLDGYDVQNGGVCSIFKAALFLGKFACGAVADRPYPFLDTTVLNRSAGDAATGCFPRVRKNKYRFRVG
jgi:hypothetical protein